MKHDEVKARYLNGEYLSQNPTWDIEHSSRKVRELRSVIPGAYLEKIFNGTTKSVVEFGCGAGGVLSGFADILKCDGIDVEPIGYDISPDAIDMARKKFGESVKFINSGEVELIEGVSLLLLVDILEHLVDPVEFLHSVKERSEYFIIRLPLDRSLWNICLGKLAKLKEELGHLHFYDHLAAVSLVSQVGLKVKEVKFVNNFSDKTNRKTLVSKIMYPVRALLSMVSPKINSRLFGGNSVVIFAASN